MYFKSLFQPKNRLKLSLLSLQNGFCLTYEFPELVYVFFHSSDIIQNVAEIVDEEKTNDNSQYKTGKAVPFYEIIRTVAEMLLNPQSFYSKDSRKDK